MPKVTSRTKTKKVRVSKKISRKGETRGRPRKDPYDRRKLVSISLPQSMIDELDSLLEEMDRTQPFFVVSRSGLIRACLGRALEEPKKFFALEDK